LIDAKGATAMSENLVEMFRHNAWANQRLFDACAGLSDAQLDTTVVGTFGNIRDTLTHIVGAQERYVAALAESGPVSVIREREPFPGLAELRDAARASGAALLELAAQAQSGATVTTMYRGENFTLPVWLLFVQAINHATEHRAQVAAILTQQGVEPPSMDGWTYHEALANADWSQLWSS
jgi:uncharacterized damage-inducible protein DinB